VAGFVRRYSFVPPIEEITAIEGVVIIDLPPPGAVAGSSTGVVAVVGEFTDMSSGVSVNSSGDVATAPRPVEIFSGQDLLDKVGGFDETIGDTGASGGSGFIALRNKKFSRLIAVPVNLASSKGVRLFRELPTCKSVTDPSPAVLLTTGTVLAGREFKSGANRARTCARVRFTADGPYKQGVDGAITAAGSPGATQTFSAATGAFTTAKAGLPVQKGDLLVLGVIGGAGALGANAATYRVTADATVATQLTVEKQDGATFDWTSGIAQPYRIHPAADGDTGTQTQASDVGGYLIPARPLDAAITGATTISPTLVPPAATATSWDPLSGLKLRSMPTSGLPYTATIQAANAVSDATLDALYSLAIDALLADALPAREVNILVTARHSDTIRTLAKAHVLLASGQGVGRSAVISPSLATVAVATVIGDAAPGVGATRAERVWYTWPGCRTFIPEAVGYSLKGADGLAYTTGILDVHMDAWVASLCSVLPPERNPGQATAPVPEAFAPILGLQRAAPTMTINEYIQLKAKGVAALRMDKGAGPLIQSGITSSLTSGQKNINRRRMADYIQDSLAQQYLSFCKLPITNAWKDSIVGETDAFLAGLLSLNNPPAQRIVGYLIDDKSGNTPDTEARGVFVVIAKARSLATADEIVLQSEIGEGVNVTAT